MSKKYWTTKFGEKIAYSDLSDKHLLNIINHVEKRATELDGTIARGGGYDSETFWTVEYSRNELLQEFGYYDLLVEAQKRKLISVV